MTAVTCPRRFEYVAKYDLFGASYVAMFWQRGVETWPLLLELLT